VPPISRPSDILVGSRVRAANTGTRRPGRTDPAVELPDLALEIHDDERDEHDEQHIELCNEHSHDR
jgi:hypothetical protein